MNENVIAYEFSVSIGIAEPSYSPTVTRVTYVL